MPGRTVGVRRLAAGVAAAALLGAALPAAADDVSIVQRGRKFVPADALTIRAGDTVSIGNEDPFFHHLYVDSDRFQYESDEQKPGEVRDIEFTTPGAYDVKCKIHLKMNLHVVVQ
jgi:plastocyanin